MSDTYDVHGFSQEELDRISKQVKKYQRKAKIKGRLKWLGKEILHILLTFIVGLIIATAYHMFIMNKNVRSTAERVCEAYGRDEQECKDGIDELLDMSDNEVQNNIEIKGE